MGLPQNQIKLYYYIILYLIELIKKYNKKAPRDKEDNIKISIDSLDTIEYLLEANLKESASNVASIVKDESDIELEEIYNVLKQNDLVDKIKEFIEGRLFQDMTGLFPQDMDTTIKVHTRIQTYKEILDYIDKLLNENS